MRRTLIWKTLINCHMLRVRNRKDKTHNLGFVFFQLPCPTGEVSTCVCSLLVNRPGIFTLRCVFRLGSAFFLWSETIFFLYSWFATSFIFCEQVLSPFQWTAQVGAGVLHLYTLFLCATVAWFIKLNVWNPLLKSRKQPENKWKIKYVKSK